MKNKITRPIWAILLSAMLIFPTLLLAQDEADADTDDDIVMLNPFEVVSSEYNGYLATATLAGTRIRTSLKDVGSSVSVVSEEFMRDTSSTSSETLLVYTTNTEVASQGGNFLGQGDGSILTDTDRDSPIANTRVRGLTEADNTRNYFLSDIPWDSFNVGRVDLQRGPNSILFGIGSPAGIINSSLNPAEFSDSNEIENQLDNYGTVRWSGDFNKVIIEDELAVRVALLSEKTKYRQNPAFEDDERLYLAVNYTPAFLNTDTMTTVIEANYETGTIDANRPRYTPPLDAITPWYDFMNNLNYPAFDATDAEDESDWVDVVGDRVHDGVVVTNSGGAQGIAFQAQIIKWPDRGPTLDPLIVGDNKFRGIATYDAYATNASLEYGPIGPYKARSLVDDSIFDFYRNLIEGPNKREFNEFDAYNASISQTFMNNLFGYELMYNYQKANWGYANYLSGDAAIITVDIMTHLLDGSPNPNIGRPFTVAGGGSAGAYTALNKRDSFDCFYRTGFQQYR